MWQGWIDNTILICQGRKCRTSRRKQNKKPSCR